MKKISIFIDDSGVFHSNHNYFVYAGFCFITEEDRLSAKKRYRSLNTKIKKAKAIEGELKASSIERKHKNSLFKVLKDEISFSVSVNLSNVQTNVMMDKKSRQRFKDYALKRVVKNLFKKLIVQGLISKTDDIELFVNIDQQGFATNGLYGLGDGILEELKYGITNFNYGTFYPPILEGKFIVHTKSCVSENDYLIQAADILANRILNSYEKQMSELRDIPNHTFLNLP
ncbi:DUF3800 domain-containing protein [Streptococcus suis]|uniref:DUF3800 domain-containing protein n=1 Tax=Streptococcus parasuis TaxID=1501662 RepID=UPI0023782C7F|nr:DUF3800 domain-containing protein [Streptococcus parasuis]MDG3180609.1 DUF3800 domain-containing protein [Streptococcus suis]WDM36983.1 DUF3800 domain-containing protein [Streptococcus parasuis]